MPQIRTFEAPALGLRPTETGATAAERAARRVQGEYNEAAAAQSAVGSAISSTVREAGDIATKFIEHQEISRGSKMFSDLIAAKTKQWDEIAKSADPNDPTVARRFLDQNLEPDLQKIQQGGFLTEKGQTWAESHIAQFRQHMVSKTDADMATLAGHAAVINTRQTINNLSNTVRGDPSGLDFSLRTLESSVGGLVDSSPNLRGAEAARVRNEVMQKGKEEIVKSAAMGFIEKTGNVPPWATDPKYSPYINGTELKQFEQAARYYQRLGRSEARADRAERDYNDKRDFNSRVNELELSTAPKNAGDPPQLPQDYWQKLRELSTHPGASLEPGRLKTMVTNGETITERLNKPEPLARVSNATTQRLMTEINSGAMADTRKIYEEFGAGNLSTAHFNFLTKAFNDIRTPDGAALGQDRAEFFKKYAASIDGAMDLGGHSALGSQRMYAFQMEARRIENDLRTKGLDPHLAYDPSSQYFVGKPENIARYRVSMQDAQGYEKSLKEGIKAPPIPLTIQGTEVKIPPPDQREVGKVYELPKGRFKWTADGWSKP